MSYMRFEELTQRQAREPDAKVDAGQCSAPPATQSLLAKLLQVVLLEVAVGAEEYPLSSADLVGFVLDRCQLYLADKVRYLLEAEVRGATVPVGDVCLFSAYSKAAWSASVTMPCPSS